MCTVFVSFLQFLLLKIKLSDFLLLLCTVQEMVLFVTSVLSSKWIVKGNPKSSLAFIGGDLVIQINSHYTINQISGQVIEREELWECSSSSIVGKTYFRSQYRRVYAAVEGAKDLADLVKDL